MSTQPSIAAANMRDAPALVALRCAVARDMTERFGEGPWSARPSREEVVRQLRASHVLVARQDAEVIGTVRLARVVPGVIEMNAFTPVASALYVLGLAVAPQCRGRGVGQQLVDAAKETARSWNAQALRLDAYEHPAGAGPFYEKCGFSRVGRTEYREIPLLCYEWITEGPKQSRRVRSSQC